MKAVIQTGGKQYLVAKGDKLDIELVGDQKTLTLEPLLVFDDKGSKVGTPRVSGATVKAKVLEADFKGDKIQMAHFKAKKRVKSISGHRQHFSKIEITDISA